MAVTPRPEVSRLARYQPGMGIEEARSRSRSGRIVKLSSNECSFGPLPGALAAARAAVAESHRYPERERGLVADLAARHGLAPEQIALAGGADSAIALLARAFLGPGDELVHARPSFVSYPIVAAQQGAVSVPVPVTADGVHDLDAMLAAVTPRTRILAVCNPNNPTGCIVPRAAVERLLAAVPDDVIVLLDEAYHEYVDDPDVMDGVRERVAAGDPRVVALRTFSKAYGLAGLRIGWAAGPPAVIDALTRFRGPFDVTDVAVAAARAALEDVDGVRRRAGLNAALRARVAGELRAGGVAVHESQANFVCVHVGDAQEATARLLADGVVVRPLGAFGDPTRIRVTVGRPSEMRVAVPAILRLLADGPLPAPAGA